MSPKKELEDADVIAAHASPEVPRSEERSPVPA
jgi:hypothetical protein